MVALRALPLALSALQKVEMGKAHSQDWLCHKSGLCKRVALRGVVRYYAWPYLPGNYAQKCHALRNTFLTDGDSFAGDDVRKEWCSVDYQQQH